MASNASTARIGVVTKNARKMRPNDETAMASTIKANVAKAGKVKTVAQKRKAETRAADMSAQVVIGAEEKPFHERFPQDFLARSLLP